MPVQDAEPALASFLHTTILAHRTLAHSMAFMLANKLSSRTLLGTQLMRMIQDVYETDPVRPPPIRMRAGWPVPVSLGCTARAAACSRSRSAAVSARPPSYTDYAV